MITIFTNYRLSTAQRTNRMFHQLYPQILIDRGDEKADGFLPIPVGFFFNFIKLTLSNELSQLGVDNSIRHVGCTVWNR